MARSICLCALRILCYWSDDPRVVLQCKSRGLCGSGITRKINCRRRLTLHSIRKLVSRPMRAMSQFNHPGLKATLLEFQLAYERARTDQGVYAAEIEIWSVVF